MPTKLPERYRQASNIDAGYEVLDPDDGWIGVTHVLRILSPANFVSLTLADGDKVSLHPRDKVMSRRPAEAVAS